jgi:hypothetical protein
MNKKKGKTERKHKGEQEKQSTKGTEGAKVLYWNVAGFKKRKEEFWDYVRQFDNSPDLTSFDSTNLTVVTAMIIDG